MGSLAHRGDHAVNHSGVSLLAVVVPCSATVLAAVAAVGRHVLSSVAGIDPFVFKFHSSFLFFIRILSTSPLPTQIESHSSTPLL